MLDEAHAAHIRGEVVNFRGAGDGADGVLVLAQIQRQRFDARHALVPHRQRLAVDGADAGVTELVEVAGQRARDEPAGARNDDQIVTVQAAVYSQFRVVLHAVNVKVIDCIVTIPRRCVKPFTTGNRLTARVGDIIVT